MIERFDIVLLEEVKNFLESLDKKVRDKILFNFWKTKRANNPELFKKLSDQIWEFRTKYQKQQFRLLAFWDKRDNNNTFVICTHGFIKKTQKVPSKEIEKAIKIMTEFLNE